MKMKERKPIFCVDITTDKENEVINGSEFITHTASKQRLEEYESKQEALEETVNKSQIPFWLRIVKPLMGGFFLIVMLATVRAGLETAWKNAPALLLSGVLCGVLWLALHLFSKAKEKRVLEEEGAEEQSHEIRQDFKSIHEEMGVPSTAVPVDVLGFRYKMKNDKLIPQALMMQPTPYINVEMRLYASEGAFHLADLEHVYSFRQAEVKRIVTENRRISVLGWNKEEDIRDEKYKPYKLTVNNMGCVFFKPYYVMEIERDGELFGLYIPSYELEIFERLTGKIAQKEEKA